MKTSSNTGTEDKDEDNTSNSYNTRKTTLPQEIAALMLSVAAHTSCRDNDVTEARCLALRQRKSKPQSHRTRSHVRSKNVVI